MQQLKISFFRIKTLKKRTFVFENFSKKGETPPQTITKYYVAPPPQQKSLLLLCSEYQMFLKLSCKHLVIDISVPLPINEHHMTPPSIYDTPPALPCPACFLTPIKQFNNFETLDKGDNNTRGRDGEKEGKLSSHPTPFYLS